MLNQVLSSNFHQNFKIVACTIQPFNQSTSENYKDIAFVLMCVLRTPQTQEFL